MSVNICGTIVIVDVNGVLDDAHGYPVSQALKLLRVIALMGRNMAASLVSLEFYYALNGSIAAASTKREWDSWAHTLDLTHLSLVFTSRVLCGVVCTLLIVTIIFIS